MFDGLLRFKISEKYANLRFPLNIQKQKCFNFMGASPLTPDQGLCPWTPLGAPPQDPRYRLALRALAMAPLCQILNTSLDSVNSASGRQKKSESIWRKRRKKKISL